MIILIDVKRSKNANEEIAMRKCVKQAGNRHANTQPYLILELRCVRVSLSACATTLEMRDRKFMGFRLK